jgi:hypothetical protein
VEYACGDAGAGRGTSAVDAIRQTHQCRLPHRSLNPADQHHDAGAGAGACAHDTASVGIVISSLIIPTANHCAVAGTTADSGASRGQKAGCAQTGPHRRAGSTGAGGTASRSGCAGARSRGGGE